MTIRHKALRSLTLFCYAVLFLSPAGALASETYCNLAQLADPYGDRLYANGQAMASPHGVPLYPNGQPTRSPHGDVLSPEGRILAQPVPESEAEDEPVVRAPQPRFQWTVNVNGSSIGITVEVDKTTGAISNVSTSCLISPPVAPPRPVIIVIPQTVTEEKSKP